MFSLIKLVIWFLGICALMYLALPYFGYEVNMNYFTESKQACQQRLANCTKEYVEQGTKNARCDFNCVDPSLIIKKQP